MKKLIYFLSLLFVFGLVADAKVIEVPNAVAGTMIIGGGVPSGATTYPDIDFYWGCESATAEKSRGDTSATAESAATINADCVGGIPVGSYTADYPSNNDWHDFGNDTTVGLNASLNEGRMGAYFYIETWPTSNNTIMKYYGDASNRIVVQVAAATGGGANEELIGIYRIGGVSTSFTTAAANLNDDTWYYIEVAWKNNPTGDDTIELFVDGSSVGSTTVQRAQATDVATGGYLETGTGGSGGGDIQMDQFIVSDDSTRDLNAIKDITSFPDS